MLKKLVIHIIMLLLILTVSGCSNAPTNSESQSQTSSALSVEGTSEDIIGSDNSDALSHTKTVDTAEVVATLTSLSSRIPGSENNKKVVKWVAGQFELLELAPLLKKDFFWSYPQTVDGQEALPQNVVGYIKGNDSAQAVVVSCHLDAVSGSAGAVDNASGVAAMLRTATNIAGYEKLNADIIFCAFNGEEQNYAGSKAFVKEFQGMYESAYNINFDCVGMIDGGSYMFGAEEVDISYTLNQEMRTYLDKHRISYGSYPVSGVRSDHISFENAKIPNINFTQIGIQSVVHSVDDQADKLDVKQIDMIADCVSEYLVKRFQGSAK